MRAAEGFIIGTLLGLAFWAAIGLAYIYFTAPATEAPWNCNTDAECEAEAARRGLPIDKD